MSCLFYHTFSIEIRREFPLKQLLEFAQLPRVTFYYYLKEMNGKDQYEAEKAEIITIYHKNSDCVL